MAGTAQALLVPDRQHRPALWFKAPGLHLAVGRVISHHDLTLQVDQRWVGDAAAWHPADRQHLVVCSVCERHPNQAVSAWADPRAHHAEQVTVSAVVHEPGVFPVKYQIPAVALSAGADVVKTPAAVHDEPGQGLGPVVAKNRTHAHHIHRVALGAEAGNRGLRTVEVGTGALGADRVDHAQAGRHPV